MEMIQQAQQPGPAQQLELAAGEATVREKNASAELKQAQAMKAMVEANRPPDIPQTPALVPPQYELPPHIQEAKALAEINKANASADQSRAAAFKAAQDASLAPRRMAQDATDRAADRDMRSQMNRSPAR